MTPEQIRRALRVYAVTDPKTPAGAELIRQIEQAIAGGATAIQLRDKRSPTPDVIAAGQLNRQMTLRAGVMFIVNDRVDLAMALDADGVHLGQEDLPPELARRLLGPDKVIGVSVGNQEEARPEVVVPADYVGVGPIFSTQTKGDAGLTVGSGRITELKPLLNRPIVAIGGVTAQNAAEAILAGADGVAAVAAIFGASDIALATRRLRDVVDAALAQREAARTARGGS